MSNPKLNFKEETSAKKTRSPPEKANVEQTQPKKKKLKLDTDKAKEKAQHLRFGKAELTPDDLRRLSKEQKREMYAAALVHSFRRVLLPIPPGLLSSLAGIRSPARSHT